MLLSLLLLCGAGHSKSYELSLGQPPGSGGLSIQDSVVIAYHSTLSGPTLLLVRTIWSRKTWAQEGFEPFGHLGLRSSDPDIMRHNPFTRKIVIRRQS